MITGDTDERAKGNQTDPGHGGPIRVLSILATSRVGGPGKGLIQLISSSDRTKVRFLVCCFVSSVGQEKTDFMLALDAAEIEYAVIRQRSAFDSDMIKQLSRIVDKFSPDILQTHGYKGHFLVSRELKRMPRPWIAMFHGFTTENYKIRFYNWLEKRLARSADLLISVSPPLHALAEKIRPGKSSRLILNAITQVEAPTDSTSVAEVLPDLDGDTQVLAVIGRLSPEKGQDIALQALKRARLADPSLFERVHMIIVGEGPERSMLEQLSTDLDLNDSVSFLGFRDDVHALICRSLIVVMPSRSEGLPNIALEALARRRPVIATDVGGVPEVVTDGENGLLVKAEDPEALASAITRLVIDTSLASNLGQSGYDSLFPKFGVERRVQEFLAAYRGVLE